MPLDKTKPASPAANQEAAGTNTPDPAHRGAVATAIATELAPEVAIALLAKTETAPDALDAALQPIAAGVSAAEDNDKIRLQLLFENGAVLPVELSKDAGEALIHGLQEKLDNAPTYGN